MAALAVLALLATVPTAAAGPLCDPPERTAEDAADELQRPPVPVSTPHVVDSDPDLDPSALPETARDTAERYLPSVASPPQVVQCTDSPRDARRDLSVVVVPVVQGVQEELRPDEVVAPGNATAVGSPEGPAPARRTETEPLGLPLATAALEDAGAEAAPEAAPPCACPGPAPDLPGPATAAKVAPAPAKGPALPAAVPAAATALVGGLLLWRLAAFLLARRAARAEPVLHPRAQVLLDAVCAQPGMSLRGLRAATGLANGVALHHLARLLADGRIVAHRHLNTVRFFENHGRYTRSWRQAAVLRDEANRRLLAWLAAHPGARQLDVVAGGTAWGWRRGLTQKRLGLLAEAGLLVARRAGREVRYEALPPAEALPEDLRAWRPTPMPVATLPAGSS